MKRFAILIIVTALLCGCLALAANAKAVTTAASRDGLKFRQDGTFKIIQISDLQETFFCSTITQEWLYDLAKKERPDLFVLTGDNISGGGANWGTDFGSRFAVKHSIDAFMNVFDKIYRDFGTPVTMVFGNHDNEDTRVGREGQFEMYAAHKSFIGWASDADKGTKDIQGEHYGTHNLLIKDHTGATPVFNLWMFDSGSNDERGGYSWVQKPQIDWFNKTNAELNKLPSFAFQHIIVPEIYDFLTVTNEADANSFSRGFVDAQGKEYTKYISRDLPAGVNGVLREAPCPARYNDGQYNALNDAGNVLAMFFGHDHVNTFELRMEGKTDLVNSPCAGFGSYGDIDLRGARVITLKESNLKTYETWHVPYQGFYGDGVLRETRLKMFQSMSTAGIIFDVVSFKPLLWIGGLFK